MQKQHVQEFGCTFVYRLASCVLSIVWCKSEVHIVPGKHGFRIPDESNFTQYPSAFLDCRCAASLYCEAENFLDLRNNVIDPLATGESRNVVLNAEFWFQ
jgi:hypothetical protein